jgi:hypothetical protein
VPADGTALPTLNEAEISVRLRLYGQLPGQVSSSLPMRTNMARRTPKHNGGLSLNRGTPRRALPCGLKKTCGPIGCRIGYRRGQLLRCPCGTSVRTRRQQGAGISAAGNDHHNNRFRPPPFSGHASPALARPEWGGIHLTIVLLRKPPYLIFVETAFSRLSQKFPPFPICDHVLFWAISSQIGKHQLTDCRTQKVGRFLLLPPHLKRAR